MMSTALFLQVEPSPPEESGKGLAFLDGEAMKQHQIAVGDVVEIENASGRTVLARVASPRKQDRGSSFLRIDQYLRQPIKSLIGDQVEVRRTAVGRVQKMVLAPLLDVSQISGLEAYLAQVFAAQGLPVAVGAVLYATLPGATGGTAFKVIEVAPAPGLVTRKTKVELKFIFTIWPGMASEVSFEDVGGLRQQIQSVRELVELPLRYPDTYRHLGISPPRGILLHGPPGTGKTLLARAIAHELKAQFLYVGGPEVVGSIYGESESNLRKVFHEASHHLPSIILIDELDAIIPKRGESGSQADTRLTTQLLELMDGLKQVEGVMVIGTTNRVEAIDRAARRPGRFDREIYFGPPTREGRLEILQIHTRGMPLQPETLDYLKEAADQTLGFVGADLMELCREAALNSIRRYVGDRWRYLAKLTIPLHEIWVEKGDFAQAVKRLRPSALRESLSRVPTVSWDDIGGLDEIKSQLQELVEKPLLHPEVFSAMGIRPVRGILLHGPPGAGKSLLARAIARSAQANFLEVKGPEVFSKWLGESEEGIRNVFRLARQVAPCVIFFDQIDALVPRRKPEAEGWAAERVVNQFLAELDLLEEEKGILVVAATNRMDLLDPAMLRPGRLGAHFFVPLPDAGGRRAILTPLLRNMLLDGVPASELVEKLVGETEGLSGADLDLLCQQAKRRALRQTDFQAVVRVTDQHFLEAVEYMRAGTNQTPRS
ncbi:MAG: AAA family ATPase [Nitrospiraceae bacterium]